MLNRFANFICPQSFKLLKFPIFCLLMNFGLLNLGYLDQTSNIASASVVASTVNSLAPIKTLPDSDGIYLYSQSSEPKQLGQGYVVFEKHNQRVIGALYMLQSEFSCFQGQLSKSGNLSLTVTSLPSEDSEIDVSSASTIPKYTSDESITYDYSILLKDYYQLKSLSNDDQEILQKCRQQLASAN